MILNDDLFAHTSIAAVLIILGVITKNSSEQVKFRISNKIIAKLGAIFFTVGWLYMAYALYQKKKDVIQILACLSILISVFVMKNHEAKKKQIPKFLPIIFVLGWITLGYRVGFHFENYILKYAGLSASLYVIVSMMFFLPKQRKYKWVDGPGMPMFVVAFAIVIVMNSLIPNSTSNMMRL